MKDSNKYNIESILWEDHTHVSRGPLPDDPDNSIIPTLSFGVVLQETVKSLVLAHDIERYHGQDDEISYTLIFKASIVARKKYGKIKLSL